MFSSLVEPLQKNTKLLKKFLHKDSMATYNDKIIQFIERFEITQNIAKELESNYADKKALSFKYLQELRSLNELKNYLENGYKDRLIESMESKNKELFEELVKVPLEPINQPRLRSEVISFYTTNYPKNSIDEIDKLIELRDLEQKSIQIIAEQEQAYEEHLRVLKKQEAQMLKKSAKVGSSSSVLLTAEINKNGEYEFEVENLNPYTITLNVDVKNLLNLKSSVKLPYFTELVGRTKKKVFVLSKISQNAPIDFSATYGWARGSAYAIHDDNYIYQLPFEKGKSVSVSQGYNGGVSHRGLSAYAIDFPVPIGTPIYAAREGVVVGAEGSNRLGGFSPDYRVYANYIIIEHSDRTMANYYHLNYNGVVVKIGQKIKKGDLIGYSGNTGYTSGPHLHFSVSKVDPVSMRRPMNMPVKIQTENSIITFPKKGDFFTVK